VGESVLDAAFARRDGALHCEGVPAERIAREAGTPTFVYSATVIRERYLRLSTALTGVPHRLHFTLKANSNRAVLSLLRELGAGVDVVSGGELFRAQQAGFAGRDILFGGVGKNPLELREALEAGIKLINVESLAELELLSRVAQELGVTAPVGLRINPEVLVDTPHAYIATGAKGHKFGIPWDDAMHCAEMAIRLPGIELAALDMHLGSQLATVEPYRMGAERLADLASRVTKAGARLRYVDVGGGLPVSYQSGDPEPDLEGYAKIVGALARDTGAQLLVEPGRFFVAASGVMLARVLYRKHSGGKDYAIVDAGMNDLLRPSHYDAYHQIDAVRPTGTKARLDVVGPVCESGDFLALDREMDDVSPGDLIAVHTAGAYGYVMASTYNARPRAAEVMVDGHRFAVVTAREQYADLVRLEKSDPEWRDA
jgi:diaminopimelate decarboxylase